MTMKEYLKNHKKMHQEAQIKLDCSERLLAMAENITRQITGMPMQQANPQKMQTCIENAVALQNEAQQMLDLLAVQQKKLLDCIGTMQRVELRMVLQLHYLLGHSFEQVAEEMNYTERQIYRLHKTALQEMEGMSVYVMPKCDKV